MLTSYGIDDGKVFQENRKESLYIFSPQTLTFFIVEIEINLYH